VGTFSISSRLGLAPERESAPVPASPDSAPERPDIPAAVVPAATAAPAAVELPAAPASLRDVPPAVAARLERFAVPTPDRIERPDRPERQRFEQVRHRVHALLLESPEAEGADDAALRDLLDGVLDQVLQEDAIAISRMERMRLQETLEAELLGFGPIEPLLQDDSVTEIMVNGPRQVWVERRGMVEETDVTFEDDGHVRRIIDRIVAPLGRRIDESSPMVDARLPDGSRVNAIIPPLSLLGPALTIRKFARQRLTMQNLVDYGTLTPEVAEFLAACVRGRANIVISGGTGSGKTTLLNILSSFIPDNERIITIEDAAELALHQRHVVPLEARPANAEGRGRVGIGQLLVNALRMRPDRIVVGECRSGEALDMLQAMNTGHDGSMATLHANSARDALSRLETMVLMGGADLPHRAIREQIASAVNVVIQQDRLQDGSRRITEIAEVQGMQGDVITLEPLFRFVQQGMDGRRVIGRLEPVGVRPKLEKKLDAHGIGLPAGLFQARTAWGGEA
jgi:pilus assembly protein CpaF